MEEEDVPSAANGGAPGCLFPFFVPGAEDSVFDLRLDTDADVERAMIEST